MHPLQVYLGLSSLIRSNYQYLIVFEQEIIPPSSNLNRQLLELLQKLLVYDPADRISAHEALKHPFFHVQLDEHGREINN